MTVHRRADEADGREAYLDEVRTLVLDEIDRQLPRTGPFSGALYGLVRDYPFRAAKTLRPALALAVCRALGGTIDAVLPSAAAIELYHNAFLIHDDVEDGSLLRRDAPTLHRAHGVPVAINVGDAMLALTLRPLLGNLEVLGLGPALEILETVAGMSVETAEGQALELDWIRQDRWDLSEEDYLLMVHKKTTVYSFGTPMAVGAIAAGAPREVRAELQAFSDLLGAAFQIRDDVLNLDGVEAIVGKESAGDLWEGKRTLILLHALRHASAEDRARAVEILGRPRPEQLEERDAALLAELASLRAAGRLAPADAERLGGLVLGQGRKAPKTEQDVSFLLHLIRMHGSVAHAQSVATERAHLARDVWERLAARVPPSIHRDFIGGLVAFVIQRHR